MCCLRHGILKRTNEPFGNPVASGMVGRGRDVIDAVAMIKLLHVVAREWGPVVRDESLRRPEPIEEMIERLTEMRRGRVIVHVDDHREF